MSQLAGTGRLSRGRRLAQVSVSVTGRKALRPQGETGDGHSVLSSVHLCCVSPLSLHRHPTTVWATVIVSPVLADRVDEGRRVQHHRQRNSYHSASSSGLRPAASFTAPSVALSSAGRKAGGFGQSCGNEVDSWTSGLLEVFSTTRKLRVVACRGLRQSRSCRKIVQDWWQWLTSLDHNALIVCR